MSITVKDLRNYRAICAEIEDLQDRIRRAKTHVFDTVKSSAEFPYSQHNVVIEGDVYDHPVAAEKARLMALQGKRYQIERFVGNIDDYRVRRIVTIYYIEPADGSKLSWEQVADKLNDGTTGDACRMLVMRYITRKGL